ncbi:conserved hypothetical protein [Pyrenophora tritici-repentis Pt-1C-BFP]|uniref:RGS domain-containing protein n=1 Tax=Pyrenophora tritici-repentis (strain Pt-1C-BFP) TaxID=426418 RepID=B2W1H2_PYRTR|nr:uncharacterized protein PTRG_04307 [Pyrenophora tritici-repentis Pt-1C-BFP]EDU47145.1 conserved hypothetical protein [Pyrenophora tritici-repentis Pt-1C-BFP]
MVTRKPGTQALSIRTSPSSTASSPTASVADFDHRELKMAMSDCQPQPQPLSVSIPKNIPSPHGRKPNLSEILNNTAPPPYTLTSFMAFLSQNHCLENLEFTMDASRYRKHYSKMVNRHPGSPISPLSDECAYVLMLWRRLIDAYIRESGPRESAHPTMSHDSYAGSNMSRSSTRSYDERSARPSQPPVPASQRASAPSSLASGFMHSRPFSHSRFHSQPTSSAQPAPRVTSGYTSGSDALTDDSGSASSPSGMSDPLTPPGTPPMSDYPMTDFHHAYYENGSHSGTPSPRNSRGDHGLASATRDSWKRVSSKLWPKKKSGGQLRDDEPGVVEGGLF